MTAVRMWVLGDLRSRWMSWVLLGVLAGATFGLAAAGVAGARRAERAVPAAERAAKLPDAAVLANDPAVGDREIAAMGEFPEVVRTYPFLVPFGLTVITPRSLTGQAPMLPPTAPRSHAMIGPLAAGRYPDSRRADEIVIDENTRDAYALDVGSRIVIGQTEETLAGVAPPDESAARAFRQDARVVGVAVSVSDDVTWTPSSGFYDKYRDQLIGVVNVFVDLRRGEADVPALRESTAELLGHPVNVELASDLFGTRKAKHITGVIRDGLLLFALAALLGGGVLVGQALVRAVVAGAADLDTWRAIGADRRIMLRALVLPAGITALAGAVTSILVAIALSPRFPVGLARVYDFDVGVHADWLVLASFAVALVAGVVVVATMAAWWRITRDTTEVARPSTLAGLVMRMGWNPAILVGSRLAVERGRGRRAVPIRSALVGAIVGVIGVVGCLTFRVGLDDAAARPERSGVVWDHLVAMGDGFVPEAAIREIAAQDSVAAAINATWHRAIPVDGRAVPVFGTAQVKRTVDFVVVNGRAPVGPDEVAFAPTTMRELGVDVGDEVPMGDADTSVTVVGETLLPASSHTDYDAGGWMTRDGLEMVAPGDDDVEDYVLVTFADGADRDAARATIEATGEGQFFSEPAQVSLAVVELGRLAGLPLALAAFFALLACATVTHALVTTVRRRGHDFAVLRSIGFTRRQSRLSIAWQATLLAVAGVVVGAPLGLALGRTVWRWLAREFPIAYVPPFALVAVLLAVPVALVLANLLAAGPAHRAASIRVADTLRTE